MSALPMYKICVNCGKPFSYNPGTGNMGLICKNCGKSANHSVNSKRDKSLKRTLTDIFRR